MCFSGLSADVVLALSHSWGLSGTPLSPPVPSRVRVIRLVVVHILVLLVILVVGLSPVVIGVGGGNVLL